MNRENEKERLTKEIIACRLLKRENKKMLSALANGGILLMTVIFALIGRQWIGEAVGIVLGIALVLYIGTVVSLYVYRTRPLKNLTFEVKTDTVFSRHLQDVPWYLRTNGKHETMMTFYEYGHIIVSYEVRNLAEKNSEFYIVVPYPNKNKGMCCYNKKFFEYCE